jgi:glyoxylase-like metal-dependent hydrolase (beta-lactamase superfamily II)
VPDNVFCGDSLFNPDVGTARCDFPGGSADNLFDSGKKLLELPPHVKIWTGHDYPPPERHEAVPVMTVQEHKELNKHLRDGIGKPEFVTMREKRDSSLGAPRLLHQSLQVNIRAGRLPRPGEGGLRVLHLPLKLGELKW